MSTKVQVSFRAAKARYNRKLAKEGQQLRTLRRPIDSWAYFCVVDVRNNVVVAYGDYGNLVNWFKEDGIIKPYEQLEQ